jgi:hypothetical protein
MEKCYSDNNISFELLQVILWKRLLVFSSLQPRINMYLYCYNETVLWVHWIERKLFPCLKLDRIINDIDVFEIVSTHSSSKYVVCLWCSADHNVHWTIRHTKILEGKCREKIFNSHFNLLTGSFLGCWCNLPWVFNPAHFS